MIRYLVFAEPSSAEARSRAAWTPGPGDTVTVRRWDVIMEPASGRAALVIPEGADGALTEAERASLVEVFADPDQVAS